MSGLGDRFLREAADWDEKRDLQRRLARYNLAREASAPVSSRYRQFQKQYARDPSGFVRDCVDLGVDKKTGRPQVVAPYQDEILCATLEHERVTARGPRGFGKTCTAAWLTLFWGLVHDGEEDWKVPTLASSWRQVEEYMWPEINLWANKVRWDKVGREPLSKTTELFQLKLKLTTGRAFGSASDDPELMEGAHSANLLFVVDEAKAVPQAMFDSLEGGFSTTGTIRVFMISTPGPPVGYFYDVHSAKPGHGSWWVKHVTCDEAIAAGRISPAWVNECRDRWGEDSAAFRNQCMGEFASSDEEGVVPTAWIERAERRWLELKAGGEFDRAVPEQVGVDVARSGVDDTVRAFRSGDWITRIERTSGEKINETTDRVRNDIKRCGRAYIDINNFGAGVYDQLEDEGLDVHPFVGMGRTAEKDLSDQLGFVNMRSLALWRVREWLDPQNGRDAALPPDKHLKSDLSAPTWRINSGGKIAVEAKDQVHKRLRRSPDAGDAVAMAVLVPPAPKEIEFW